MFLQELFNFKL